MMTASRRLSAPPLWGCTASIPLPTAYLDDITQRREGHEALQGFLDIFSHRILTQFYRIWRKYSYPATFEPGGPTHFAVAAGPGGAGYSGTANHIATPVSRFLALLGVLRQPGKTQEGMQALVTLLAPDTTVRSARIACGRWKSAGRWVFTAMTIFCWTAIRPG
jgi:predicted component of type VI protein secretion system